MRGTDWEQLFGRVVSPVRTRATAAVILTALMLAGCPRTPPQKIDLEELSVTLSLTQPVAAYWPLRTDARDESQFGNHGIPHGVRFDAVNGAEFDGAGAFIEVPDSSSLEFGNRDFTISAWVQADGTDYDTVGDIVSKYDPLLRRGLNIGIRTFAGVTSGQPNYRNLHFGINEDAPEQLLVYRGRPGDNAFTFCFAVFDGQLYVGTFENEAGQRGHVYRYLGGTEWEDCGAPDPSNAIMSLVEYQGNLYAGAGTWSTAGTTMPPTGNLTPGGAVYRYEGGKIWTYCGHIAGSTTQPDNNRVWPMIVYQDSLYAGRSNNTGVFRYTGGTTWVPVGGPNANVFTVFNGALYAGNAAGVWRYDGDYVWTQVRAADDHGPIERPEYPYTQIYTFAVHRGNLLAGVFPSGFMFAYNAPFDWKFMGRVGLTREVQGTLIYNGDLISGTMGDDAPLYRYVDGTDWVQYGQQLDLYHREYHVRSWATAVYDGKLFVGMVPSGYIYSLESGINATVDWAFPQGWRHVACVRSGNDLAVYLDGELVSESSAPETHSGELIMNGGFDTWKYGVPLGWHNAGGIILQSHGPNGPAVAIVPGDENRGRELGSWLGIRIGDAAKRLADSTGAFASGGPLVFKLRFAYRAGPGARLSVAAYAGSGTNSPYLISGPSPQRPSWFAVPSSDTWTTITYDFHAIASADLDGITLYFAGHPANSGVAYVDDVSLTLNTSSGRRITPFEPPNALDITNRASLYIGFGQENYFRGRIRDVFVFPESLDAQQIMKLRQKAGD